MKLYIPLIALLSLLAACSQESIEDHEGYLITGTLASAPKGIDIYLERFLDNNSTVIDTATTNENGEFQMIGYVKEKGIHSLRVQNTRTIMLVLEPGKLRMELNAGFPTPGNYTLTGHEESTVLANYINSINGYYNRITQTQQQLNRSYQQGFDPQMVAGLQAQYKGALVELGLYVTSFIDTVKSGMLAVFATNMLDPSQQIDHMRIALNKLKQQAPNSPYASSLEAKLQSMASTAIGAPAPEISLPSPAGQIYNLSRLKGSIVLVDFWASWCGPCRKENPNLVRLYAKYKDKGFKIFSVSLDNDKGRWVRAIQQDRLEWSDHVSELVSRRWADKVLRSYNFNSIPTSYLIDAEGNILAKNLRGQGLAKKLAEVLDS